MFVVFEERSVAVPRGIGYVTTVKIALQSRHGDLLEIPGSLFLSSMDIGGP